MAEMQPGIGLALKKTAEAIMLARMGLVDVLVSQPPPAGPDSPELADIEKIAKDAMWDNLTLFGVKLIFTVENLTRVVSDACGGADGSLKVRNLRIMSHGNSGQCRIGLVQVIKFDLSDPNNPKRKELEKLKPFLAPGISTVHIHACRTGDTEEFLKLLSKLWGNVTVRSFTDYQSQTGNKGEILEQGPAVSCTGDYCETKVAPKP